MIHSLSEQYAYQVKTTVISKPNKMSIYCCWQKCIESPSTQVDGVAYVHCKAFNYCHCRCVTYTTENDQHIKFDIEINFFTSIKRKLENAVYGAYDIDGGLEYLDKMREHLLHLQQLVKK